MIPNSKPPSGVKAGTAMVNNHVGASQMAHMAAAHSQARRMFAGKGISGPKPPMAPGAPAAPQGPAGIGGGPVGPSAPGAPATPGNYKDHLGAIMAAHGVQAGVPEIHGAIDKLTQAGRFSPAQGAMLKAHNGPLVGPQGQATMGAIAGALLPRPPAPPMAPAAGPQMGAARPPL